MNYKIQQQLDTHFDNQYSDIDSSYVIANDIEVDFNQLTLDDIIELERMNNQN